MPLSRLPTTDRIDPLRDLLCLCAFFTLVINVLSKLCIWVAWATLIWSHFLLQLKLTNRFPFQTWVLQFFPTICLHWWWLHTHLLLESYTLHHTTFNPYTFTYPYTYIHHTPCIPSNPTIHFDNISSSVPPPDTNSLSSHPGGLSTTTPQVYPCFSYDDPQKSKHWLSCRVSFCWRSALISW